jgi:phosphoserine phosphatase RsbU/P
LTPRADLRDRYPASVTADGDAGEVRELRLLQALTDVSLSRQDLDELLATLLGHVRALMHADTAAVLLVDPSGQYLIATAAAGLEEEVRQGVRLPIGRGFAGTVAARAHPVRLEQVNTETVLNPILLDKGLSSLLGVPLLAAGRVIGVLHIGTLEPRRFTETEIGLLQRVAERVSLATQVHTSHTERAATIALQRSLLPARPPDIPGLEFATRYVPGTQAGIGGDWYDLFRTPSGHIGLVIGDVAGHGLRAAVVMGRIRSALRAYALESDDPADVLSRLDRKIQHFEQGMMATAIYAVIEPSHEHVHLSVAGHPPPLFAAPDQPARLLATAPDILLGVTPNSPRHTETINLPPGALLFFYTDGLIERRDQDLSEGWDALRQVITADPPELVCSRAMATLIADEPAPDDIAVLTLRRVAG